MSKFFLEENYEATEVELKDTEGKSYIVKSKNMTLEDIEFIETISEDKAIKASKQITSILIRIFGKEENFWKKFSLNLLTDLTQLVTEEVKKKQSPESK